MNSAFFLLICITSVVCVVSRNAWFKEAVKDFFPVFKTRDQEHYHIIISEKACQQPSEGAKGLVDNAVEDCRVLFKWTAIKLTHLITSEESLIPKSDQVNLIN
jgi:hypothetical protein